MKEGYDGRSMKEDRAAKGRSVRYEPGGRRSTWCRPCRGNNVMSYDSWPGPGVRLLS